MDPKFVALRIAFSPLRTMRDYGSEPQEHAAILTQRVDPKDGEQKWAYVAKNPNPETGKRQVLEYFGKQRPSEERVEKAAKRVQYFKNMGQS